MAHRELMRDTESFMSGDTERIEYVCWHCVPGTELDRDALVLFRRECHKHGPCWHRKMVRHADGSLALAIPLEGPPAPGAFREP